MHLVALHMVCRAIEEAVEGRSGLSGADVIG
jgi:hypothetical protein